MGVPASQHFPTLLATAQPAQKGAEGANAPSFLLFEAGVATAVFIGVVILIWIGRRIILSRLQAFAERKGQGLAPEGLRHLGLKRSLTLVRGITRLLSVVLVLGALFLWLTFFLECFAATRATALEIEKVLWTELESLLLAGAQALPGLAVAGIILLFARWSSELVNLYFRAITRGEIRSTLFDSFTAETSRRLGDLVIWIAAIILVYPYLPGSESAAFRGISVLAGLMLTFGSTHIVSQFTQGLSLLYGRVIRPGDFVRVGDDEGRIEHIGLFSCTLRTSRDVVITLPHSTVASGVKNFSRAQVAVRLSTAVTIGYDAPWPQIHQLLLAAATDTSGIRPHPAPEVRQKALDDFYVCYELLFTPEAPHEKDAVLSRLHQAIQDRFHRAGVQIMSPHYWADPSQPKIPPASSPS